MKITTIDDDAFPKRTRIKRSEPTEPIDPDFVPRTVVWFSCGAASAVAAKIAIAEAPGEVVIVYTDPSSEHEDNYRFLEDCAKWFGQPVIVLHSEEFEDTWDVWEKKKFILGPRGAPCTIALKKQMRYKFERPTDRQVFGYTLEEVKRADQFRDGNPGVDLWCPLIDHGLGKGDCLAMVERAGIELPITYSMGYEHANCIGCPKGGLGYWNKIRVDFPEAFDRMAKLERKLNFATHKDKDGMVFLDELDPNRGNMYKEPAIECSLVCVDVEERIAESEMMDAEPVSVSIGEKKR